MFKDVLFLISSINKNFFKILFRIVLILFLSMVVPVVVLIILIPFSINMHEPQYLLKKWTPKIFRNELFWLNYLFDSYFSISIGFFTPVIDFIVFDSITQASSQIEILKLRLKDLVNLPQLECKQETKKLRILEGEQIRLDQIIKLHQKILKY